MKVKITPQIKNSINSLGNKTARNSGLQLYTALYLRYQRRNKHGYFDCPAEYLAKINSRYYNIIDQFIKDRLITYQTNMRAHPKDLFAQPIVTKNYSTKHGYCMKYRFLVDIDNGEEIDVDFISDRECRWYTIIKNSLISLGYPVKISRDSFGRRVYYTSMNNYKTEFAGKGLCVIDSKASQPRLLYLIMKEKNIVDPYYNAIFEKDIYFYDYLISKLEIEGTDYEEKKGNAKKLFTFWINSAGYVPDNRIHKLFPVASRFIKQLKSQYYKDSAAFFQREEAKIWIDDLLENIPVEFALPVHDSLIVRKEDLDVVLQYCKDKYPDLRFDKKEL